MSVFLKLLATFLGGMFPILLLKAIKAQQEESPKLENLAALTSLCFGGLVFIIMLFLPD